MQQVQFERNIDNILAQADDKGLWVHCGWSIGISRADAVQYVKTYNTHPNRGFYEHDGKVVLTHAGAKLTLSAPESAAVIGLIKSMYPEA